MHRLKLLALGVVLCLPGMNVQAEQAQAPLPRPASVADYVAPKDRNIEMQIFDKTILFLSAQQEDDGHWDAKKAGASAEFSNLNGDISSTALATYSLLCTAQGKQQNRDAMMRAKRGLEWLRAHMQPDGRIADESAPGEPVVAQLLSAMAFLQSASMSTRTTLRESAIALSRYAILKMPSGAGGFGAVPHAPAARADVTALATFTFRSARMEDVKFDETNVKVDTDIENGVKAGLKALLAHPEKADGIYSLLSSELKPDWNATVGGALTQVLLLAPPSALSGAMKYILKEDGVESGTFPALKAQFGWGQSGEGYRALSLWQGSLSIVYLFQEHTREWKAWTSVANPILREHQDKDGGWNAAGADGDRGKIWRASLHAMSLILLAPAPPPPTLPPDSAPTDPAIPAK